MILWTTHETYEIFNQTNCIISQINRTDQKELLVCNVEIWSADLNHMIYALDDDKTYKLKSRKEFEDLVWHITELKPRRKGKRKMKPSTAVIRHHMNIIGDEFCNDSRAN